MDSTAAAFLLPEDTIMAYNERSFTSMIDHRNALRLFDAWKEILGRLLVLFLRRREGSVQHTTSVITAKYIGEASSTISYEFGRTPYFKGY